MTQWWKHVTCVKFVCRWPYVTVSDQKERGFLLQTCHMASLGYNCFILQSREVLEKLNSDSKLVVGLNVRMAVCICYSCGRVATFQDLPTSHPHDSCDRQ